MKRGREEELDVKDIEKFLNACGEEGDMAIVQEYIKIGGDVNARNKDNQTGLHYAALYGHVDVVKMLIEKGADVNAVDIEKQRPIHRAAYYGHVEIAKMLLQNGADVNAVDKLKQTPLHFTTDDGYVDVAKVLIQNGVDVNAADEYKRAPLHNAALNQYAILTLQLLCSGAQIDKKALEDDETGLLGPINDRMNLLRAGKRPETPLMSNEERYFMWNLAFSLTIQHRAAAFKVYYTVRSFITFHGIFMADGYDLGEESVWKRTFEEEDSFW